MERHTLCLWGVAAALLIVTVKLIFTPERFPVVWQRAVAVNVLAGLALAAVGYWDYRLTLRTRARRDETLSFAQVQLRKVWWLIVGLIVALNFGMYFFGGGYMFYSILLALVGLGFCVYGLFSEQMHAWVGALMLGFGIGGAALKLSFPVMEWLAIFVLGVGLPALALILEWRHDAIARRVLLLVTWAALVLAPTAAVTTVERSRIGPELPVVSLTDYQASADAAQAPALLVRLPVGTVIPLRMEIEGDVLASGGPVTVPVTLTQNLDVRLRGGALDGYYRVDGGAWRRPRYDFHIRRFDMAASLTRERGPEGSLTVQLTANH
jgi:hypothetical protein